MSGSAHDTLHAALRRDAARLGPQLAALAHARGLAFTNPDGSTRPLPIAITPVIIARAELERRLWASERISAAAAKLSRALLRGPERERVLAGLSPLERTLAEQTFEATHTLVTTRVDYFGGKALEINATIPAMQGYSDIAARSFVEVVGAAWGLDDAGIATLLSELGSNARALHHALLAGYRTLRPGREPQRIALLCRRFDAQLSELAWLRDRMRELGSEVDIVHPDQLAGDDEVRAAGKVYDLVYRHVFVRRLEAPDLQGAAYVQGLLRDPPGKRAVVLNPPASQIEAKLTFARLSRALDERELAQRAGLDDDELAAVREAMPWTRAFDDPALAREVAAEPDRWVIKRSWDYGGRTVFVGRTRETSGFAERVAAIYGEPLSWAQLCERALADREGGGFVAQHYVDNQLEPHVIVAAEGLVSADLHVDFSCFASVGLGERVAWTGVCRGSTSPIVNLHAGGGLLPLIDDVVAARLSAMIAP
jgi:hypothetical protein